MNLGLGMGLGFAHEPSTAAFTPAQLASLQLWLDATTLAGSPIATFTDRSTHGRDFTAAGGARPTRTASNATLNGKASVDFDGATSIMTSAATVAQITAAGVYTAFVVGINRAAGAPAAGYAEAGILSDNASYFAIAAALNDLDAYLWDGAEKKATVAPTNGQAFRLCAQFDGAHIKASLNGGAFQSANAGASQVQTGTLILGANYASGVLWNGSLGELIVCNAVLSAPDLALVQAYLSAKWGV